jgi:hypothetical protein
MKLLLNYILVLIVSFNSAIVGSAQTSPNRADIFNPSGDYHPLSPANESEKFIQFDLQVRRRKGKLVAWGEVRGVQPWYKFTSVFVTEKQLKFSTAKVGGVSYDFDGTFLGKGDFASQFLGNGMVMLEGRLRKFVNGKKTLEVSTSFVYYPGC